MKNWEIRNCTTDNEIGEVVQFLNNEYGDDLGINWNLNQILNKINFNPNGQGIMLAAYFNEKVISCLSLTMKKILIDSSAILVAEIGDSYTARSVLKNRKEYSCAQAYIGTNQYINQSIFARLVYEIELEAKKRDVNMIYGTPNYRSLPGYTKKLLYSDSISRNSNVALKICLTERLLEKKVGLSKPFSSMFAYSFEVLQNVKEIIFNYKSNKYKIENISSDLENEIDLFLENNIESGELLRNYRWYQCRFMQDDVSSEYNGYIYRSLQGDIKGLIYIKLNPRGVLTIADWVISKDKFHHDGLLRKILNSKNYQSYIVKIWTAKNDKINEYLNKLFFIRIKKIDIVSKDFGSSHIFFKKFHISFSDNI